MYELVEFVMCEACNLTLREDPPNGLASVVFVKRALGGKPVNHDGDIATIPIRDHF